MVFFPLWKGMEDNQRTSIILDKRVNGTLQDDGRICIDKIMLSESHEFQDGIVCDHTTEKKCHTTYKTVYTPHQVLHTEIKSWEL